MTIATVQIDETTVTVSDDSSNLEITINDNSDIVTVFTNGESNLGNNLGSGADVFKDKTNVTFNFRTLTAQNLVTVTELTDEIRIGVDPSNINTSEITNDAGFTTYDSTDFDTDFAAKDTDDLSEGATNLYYTQARVQTEVDSYVDKAFVDALNVNSDTLDSQEGTYYLDYTNFTNTPVIPSDTDDITEATNLYFTDERVDDRVNALLVEGSDISLTYDDVAGTLTIASTATGVTTLAELTDVSITTPVDGALLAFNNSTSDWEDVGTFASQFDTALATKDTDDLSEGTTNLYFTDERVDDRVNALFVEGDAIGLTYDDGANTLTVQVDDDSITFAKMQNIATNRILGRDSAGTGDIEALTANAATDLLRTFNTGNSGIVPASGGGTTNFLRADGSWAQPAYYDSTDFDTDFATKDTDDLSEGATNLYYTDARANAAIDARVDASFVNGLDITVDGGTY